MPKTFTAQLRDIERRRTEDMRWVARTAIHRVLEGAQTPQIGITQGATSYVEGKIPVGLTAELINSLTVDGAQGPDAYVVAIAGLEIGEVMRFAWTAPHAMPMEVGYTGEREDGSRYQVPGRFYVTRNAERFGQHVEAAIAELG